MQAPILVVDGLLANRSRLRQTLEPHGDELLLAGSHDEWVVSMLPD